MLFNWLWIFAFFLTQVYSTRVFSKYCDYFSWKVEGCGGSFCRRRMVRGTFDRAFELSRSTSPPQPLSSFRSFVLSFANIGVATRVYCWNAPEFRGGCERRDKFYLTPVYDASEHCVWTTPASLLSFFTFLVKTPPASKIKSVSQNIHATFTQNKPY